MQTPTTLRSGHIFMKDANSVEWNEISVFLVFYFELRLIVFTIYGDTPRLFLSVSPIRKKNCSKVAKMLTVLNQMKN